MTKARPVTGLFVLAVFYTLVVGKAYFLPIAFAVYLSFVFEPVVRGLARSWIPRPVGAAIVLGVLLGALVFGLSQLTEPATEWIQRAPEALDRVERRVGTLLKPARQMTEAAAQVERLAAPPSDHPIQQVEVRRPGILSTFLTGTRNVLGGLLITAGLLYFLLTSGHLLLRKWVANAHTRAQRRRALTLVHDAGAVLMRYLFTTMAINVGLGVLTGFAMWLWGMPNPVLWGVLGGFLNFLPYIGALAGALALGLAASFEFDSFARTLLIPLTYWALTALESGLVTPMLLGRRFSLNPVFIALSLILWGWVWGIPGTLLAVPILVAFKFCCDYNPSLRFVGSLLEQGRPRRLDRRVLHRQTR